MMPNVKMYTEPETDRKMVQLNQQQIAAALPTGQPTMIIGPAGCGKSLVLTEKVKRIVEGGASPYDPGLRMLLTTFNKRLVRTLGDWLMQVLDGSKCKRERRFEIIS